MYSHCVFIIPIHWCVSFKLSSGHLKSLNVSESYAAAQIKQFDAVQEQQFIAKASSSSYVLTAASLLSLSQLALSPIRDAVQFNSDVSGEKKHSLVSEKQLTDS